MRIPDPRWEKIGFGGFGMETFFGSGMEKIRIRDEHSGSATLIISMTLKKYHWPTDLKHDGIRDGAEGPDGGGPVAVLLPRHVLGEGRSHDDHVLRNVG